MLPLLVLALIASTISTAALDVTVNVIPTQTISRPIAPNFVSYSLEVSGCNNWFGNDTKQVKKSFVRLMEQNMFTPGQSGPVFRIGGNSADESIWNPSHAPLPAGDTYSIDADDLVLINNAVQAVNSRAIYGLNFRDSTSAAHAIDHAQAIDQTIGWESVESLEIGNENDLYGNNHIREKGYDYKQYNDEWTMYTNDIQSALPNQPIKFEGATFAGDHWYPNISHYAKEHQSVLSSISIHNYPLTHCNGKVTTIADLLTDHAAQAEAADIVKHKLVQALDAMNIPLYLGEGNSASCGGMPGVSNVFASTLWALDYLFNLAVVGVQRMNFHGGGGTTSYTTIAWPHPEHEQPTVMPLFYAHHVFARATRGNAQIVKTQFDQSDAPFLKIWSTRNVDELNIVMLHKNDTSSDVTVAFNVTAPYAKFGWPVGELRTLRAPSLAEESNVVFGGISWSDTKDGEPVGLGFFRLVKPVVSTDGSHAVYSVSVLHASGALLQLKMSGHENKNDHKHARHNILKQKIRS